MRVPGGQGEVQKHDPTHIPGALTAPHQPDSAASLHALCLPCLMQLATTLFSDALNFHNQPLLHHLHALEDKDDHVVGSEICLNFCCLQQLLKQPDQDLQSLEVCHTAPLAQGMCQPAPFTHVGSPVQGVGRLTLSFQQLAVAAMSIGAIHTLQAASVHPPITKIAAGLFFLVGGAAPQVRQS